MKRIFAALLPLLLLAHIATAQPSNPSPADNFPNFGAGWTIPGYGSGAGAGFLPWAAAPVVVTSAVASSQVLKATPGVLLSVGITNTTVSGYLMLFNATSAPADGAVTPILCEPVAAGGSTSGGGMFPLYFSAGITAVFSTTGCFTKTSSSTAFIRGQVQ